MTTPKSSHRILAQQIADALFESSTGHKAVRLVLMVDIAGVEFDSGGWCREAAIDRIEKALKEQNKP